MPAMLPAALTEILSAKTPLTLDSLALIEVRGAEAREFLQGQLSNDVDAAQPLRAQLHAYCNPQGRALAVLHLIAHEHGFWLVTPADLADAVVARLKMFVLRAKVEVARSECGLAGALHDATLDAPGVTPVTLEEIPGARARKFFIGARDALAALSPAPGDAAWRIASIVDGLAQVYAQTTAQFIPQMLNLDCTGGLSFRKGCYPGQEIIARLRYRGKVKQRMLCAVTRESKPPAPGDSIFAAQAKKVGRVVDAVACGGDCILSACVSAPLLQQGALHLHSDGAELTRIALPYSTEDDA